MCDSAGHLLGGDTCVAGPPVCDKSMLCGVRPGASARRGRGWGRGASPAREAAASPCTPCWNGKHHFCLCARACVCVCARAHPWAGRTEVPQVCRSVLGRGCAWYTVPTLMGVPAQRDHWDAGKHQEGVGGEGVWSTQELRWGEPQKRSQNTC